MGSPLARTVNARPLLWALLAVPAAWILSGQTKRFQFWYRDPVGPCGTGFNLSNALVLTFTP